jgi:2-polyprenyl-6-methoxyphenol hydroxylase-like FAD-dependent oxidoreductase
MAADRTGERIAMINDVDVLVVGGGPSGLTVAAEVARTGASVLVVEKRTAEPIPRSGTVLPRPLELFDARGIADRFIERNCEINPNPFQTWHIWAGMAPVDWSRRESRFGFTLMLPQSESETILRNWAIETGASLEFQQELVDLTQHPDHVQATVKAVDGTEQTISARYVVGADGGRSRVRESAGIEQVGHGDSFTGMIATAAMPYPYATGSRVGQNEHGWMSVAPFGVGLTRFTIVHAERRRAARDEPITIPELTQCVSDILGEHLDIPSLVGGTRYGDAMWMSNEFRRDRVFLVGDAARIHYPASGVGMNFCIQDAFNLGWKLAAVISGDAEASLLDTYETERRPIADDLFESVNAQVAVQFDFTPRGLTFRKHYMENFLTKPDVTERLWAELNGLETPYPGADGSPGAVGLPAPDFELFARNGSTVRLYELLRTSRFVILDLSGTGALRTLGSELTPAAGAVVIEAQPIRRPQALSGVSALIVRPDTYVAWAATGRPEPDVVRNELYRALHLAPASV